jgi:hypothetical protein
MVERELLAQAAAVVIDARRVVKGLEDRRSAGHPAEQPGALPRRLALGGRLEPDVSRPAW